MTISINNSTKRKVINKILAFKKLMQVRKKMSININFHILYSKKSKISITVLAIATLLTRTSNSTGTIRKVSSPKFKVHVDQYKFPGLNNL